MRSRWRFAAEPHSKHTQMDTVAEGAAAAENNQGSSRASSLVAGGILLSRIAGLVREAIFGAYFGTSLYADVFRDGLRMPNVLQNLLGEGTLSASFIPVYSGLLAEGRRDEAGRVAGAMFSLMLAVAGGIALLGFVLAPVLTTVFLPGFEGERRELTILVSRIIFPMTGILVLSAWALGILNSHRVFFVPYVAPVLWNLAMITTMLIVGGVMNVGLERLLISLAWAALVGGALQFAVQMPWVLRNVSSFRVRWDTRLEGVREALRNAGPAIMGRGVVQVSGYLDMVLASLLAVGAVAAIGYAQTIYLLPISLFGLSIAAAELPELSRHGAAAIDALRERTVAALRRMYFFVIPSFVAIMALGDIIVAGLYQRGRFDRGETLLVYATLAAYAVGLLATTASRLYSSAFFALRDTRTPARVAGIRVAIATILGIAVVLQVEFMQLPFLDRPVGFGTLSDWRIGGQPLGAVGLALGTGIAAWVEFLLLRRTLSRRFGGFPADGGLFLRMFAAAVAAAAAGWAIRMVVDDLPTILRTVLVCAGFGAVYFAAGAALGLGEAKRVWERARRLLRR